MTQQRPPEGGSDEPPAWSAQHWMRQLPPVDPHGPPPNEGRHRGGGRRGRRSGPAGEHRLGPVSLPRSARASPSPPAPLRGVGRARRSPRTPPPPRGPGSIAALICVAGVLVALVAGVMSRASDGDRLPRAETSALGASGRLPERIPLPPGAPPGDPATGPAGPDAPGKLVEPGGPQPDGAADAAAVAGIPTGVLKAYRGAETELGTVAPGCRLTWPLLAAIGKVESDHARDGAIDATGTTLAPILGPLLDGSAGTAAIPDTDGGNLDADPVWDRAVGPSQFIPSTWRVYGIDANDDGSADPNNVDDAATATGRYLCAGDTSLADPTQLHDAVFRYNHSESYVATVLDWARTYGGDVAPADPNGAPEASAPGDGRIDDPATPPGPVLLAGPDDPLAAPPVALPPAAPGPVAVPPAAPAPVVLPPAAPAPVVLPPAAPGPVALPPAAPAPVALPPVPPPASRPATTTPPRPATPARVPTTIVAPSSAATTPPRAVAPTAPSPPTTTAPPPTTALPRTTTTTPPSSTTTSPRIGQDQPCAGLDATAVATALGVDPSSARTTTSAAGGAVACTVSTRAGVILSAALTDSARGGPMTASVGGVTAAPGGGWQVSGDVRGRQVVLRVPSAAGVTAQNARTALPLLVRRCG